MYDSGVLSLQPNLCLGELKGKKLRHTIITKRNHIYELAETEKIVVEVISEQS